MRHCSRQEPVIARAAGSPIVTQKPEWTMDGTNLGQAAVLPRHLLIPYANIWHQRVNPANCHAVRCPLLAYRERRPCCHL